MQKTKNLTTTSLKMLFW